MKRMWVLFVLACGGAGALMYDNNDLELLTAYRAKELCSCLFVMEMDDAYCIEWTIAQPNIATFQIDHQAKTVSTEALLMWGARARFESERFGCLLDK